MLNIREQIAGLSLRIFGNSLGLKTNLLYWLQHSLSSANSKNKIKVTSDHKKKAMELRHKGFVKLDPIDVHNLSHQVADYFSKNPCKNGMGEVSKDIAPSFAELIYEGIAQTAVGVLRAYYNSEFQPYWATISRYEVCPGANTEGSFHFHIDDNPRQLLKIFIYLNDVYKSNSAFRTFPYSSSVKIIKKGFVSYTAQTRSDSQKYVTPELIEKEMEILEGLAGTILIFDNNLIHKGTAPEIGYRHVVCVEVYPSQESISIESLRKGLMAPIKKDFPTNPFYNDIQRN